jgi:DNA-binding response OmpR family regulator
MNDAPAPTARRALVVDDEVELGRLVGDYLSREGFAVDVVRTGAEALDLARATAPDVVVLQATAATNGGAAAARV